MLDEPALKNYHLLPSVRGDFLFKRSLLLERALDCTRALPPG